MGNTQSGDERYIRERLQKRYQNMGLKCFYCCLACIAIIILGWLIYSRFIYQCEDDYAQFTFKCSNYSYLFYVICCQNEQKCDQPSQNQCQQIYMSQTKYSIFFWIAFSCAVLTFLCTCCLCTKRYRISDVKKTKYVNGDGDLVTHYQYKYQQYRSE